MKKVIFNVLALVVLAQAEMITECGNDYKEAHLMLQAKAIEISKGISVSTEIKTIKDDTISNFTQKSIQKLNGYKSVEINKEFEQDGLICLVGKI